MSYMRCCCPKALCVEFGTCPLSATRSPEVRRRRINREKVQLTPDKSDFRFHYCSFDRFGPFRIATLRSVPIGTVSRNPAEYSFRMRMVDMTPRLLLAVPCPSCGAAAGKGCLFRSGRPRSELHIDRKLCAIEAVEKQREPRAAGGSTYDQNISRFG